MVIGDIITHKENLWVVISIRYDADGSKAQILPYIPAEIEIIDISWKS